MPQRKKSCHCHSREPHHHESRVASDATSPKAALKYVSKRADLRSRQPRSAVTVTMGKPRKPLTLAERRARAADRSYSAVLFGVR